MSSRPPYFAQRFIRLLTKTAAAQDLGPSACWMLAVIACQEDAKRYTEPAKFYYEQLMPLCGFNSRKQLRTAIEKAVGLGWLNYSPGGKGVPGRFSVMVPAQFGEIPHSGCDEISSSDSELQTELQVLSSSDSELKAELQRERMRNYKGNTSIPSPSPLPNKEEAPSASSPSEKKKPSKKQPDFDPLSVEFPPGLQTDRFRDAWADWVAHRIEKTKPLTPTSVKSQLRQFADWGEPRAVAAIAHTVFRGWIGIREPELPAGQLAPTAPTPQKMLTPIPRTK